MKNSSITFSNPSIEPVRSEATFVARALLKGLALFQRLSAGRVSACRFYPSCSNYALRRSRFTARGVEAHSHYADCRAVAP